MDSQNGTIILTTNQMKKNSSPKVGVPEAEPPGPAGPPEPWRPREEMHLEWGFGVYIYICIYT